MLKRFFIAGTDTNVGKTYVACNLLRQLKTKGFSTVACKPLASGCEYAGRELQNDDALKLQQAATIKIPYHAVNPIAYQLPIAPHIAAAQLNQTLSVKQLISSCNSILQCKTDYLIMEGVGGWLMPLNSQETMADFVIALDLSVILVVAMRLGCLNHSLLTVHNMVNRRARICGWIANCIDPQMGYLQENIQTLVELLPMPLLGIVPHGVNSEHNLNLMEVNCKNT